MSALSEIVAAAAAETGVSADEIMGKRHFRRVVRARWEVWARLAKLGWSTTQIGKPWRYDHTTIMHGLNQIGAKAAFAKGGPPNPMPDFLASAEKRRAETIRRYWAARGIAVDIKLERVVQENGRSIPAVRSSGIPVRGVA